MSKAQQYYFTIGIPVYNAQETITDAILSAQNQKTNYSYEIVIVDDGSKDATSDICKSLSSSSSNISYVKTPNQGPLLARRHISQIAQGKYLIFLDADDMIRVSTLQKCGEAIDLYHPDIVLFDYSYNSDFTRPHRNSNLASGLYKDESLIIARASICKGESNQLCSKAIRKSLIDLDSDYDTFSMLCHGEDLFQLLPIVDNAHSFLRMQECLYYYRQSNLSGTFHYSETQLSNIDVLKARLLTYGENWNLNQEAFQGIILQYCYLFKILYRDESLPAKVKKKEFQKIRQHIIQCFKDQKASLRTFSIPWRLFVYAVINNYSNLIRILVKLSK